MTTTSVWRGSTPEVNFPTLDSDIVADVAIVGGGITGVTLATLLADAGKSVVLIEATGIGLGATGNSTGNLYETTSQGLHEIDEKWDQEVMRKAAQSRGETIRFIEHTVERLGIECRFRRCPLTLYATTAGEQETVANEYHAATQAGLAARMEDELPLPLVSGQPLVLYHQAQFHPLAYIRQMAQRSASTKCQYFEYSPATAIDERNAIVHTEYGKVTAQDLVIATHTPKGLYLVQAEMEPYREYGIACQLSNEAYPDGIFWGLGDYPHSLRSLRHGDLRYLILVGERQKTGQHNAVECLRRLEAFARKHFEVTSVDFHWSAQNYRSPDYLPYIGRVSSEGAYIATGFATDGLTYGTLAARIIADDILKRKNPWAEMYSASRLAPVQAARGLWMESMNVAKALVKDYVIGQHATQLSALAPGDGGIVEVNGEKMAAYRDERGALMLLSPVCTHMKCMVHWNNAEKSWDCPCHGSRFAPDGEVIEGPALTPLQPKQLPD